MSLLDQLAKAGALAGEVARDNALERVATGAGAEWLAEAQQTVLQVARRGAEFTSDDVWREGLAKPREPRALGAVFAALNRAGIIEQTGRWQLSTQHTRHRAPIAVWRQVQPSTQSLLAHLRTMTGTKP